MVQAWYELIVNGARYVFIFLVFWLLLGIAIRSFKEFRMTSVAKKQLQDVSPGYLEIIAPENMLGEKRILLRESFIGSSKKCNISIEMESVAPVHAVFFERKGTLYIECLDDSIGVLLNGERLSRRGSKLYTQDCLQFGELVCILHLAGEEEDE